MRFERRQSGLQESETDAKVVAKVETGNANTFQEVPAALPRAIYYRWSSGSSQLSGYDAPQPPS